MSEDIQSKRRPTTQDISWLLDLARNNQLDLNPPYQRRSVWTRKDRQFFLDTIFRDFPSPAIFLHKTISDDGRTIYHVVDGKQRIETILAFADDQLRMAKNYGNVRLDGKKWSELEGESALRQTFWNYELSVEMLKLAETTVINEAFDRLNRNSRRLTRQELRHARFDGWFMTLIEKEAQDPQWRELGLITPARERRMSDSQTLSEMLLVVLEGKIHGFDQDFLDERYAHYNDLSVESDEPENTGTHSSQQEFLAAVEELKEYLTGMNSHSNLVQEHAKTVGNFYTLAALIALHRSELDAAHAIAPKYQRFMARVASIRTMEAQDTVLPHASDPLMVLARDYWNASRGASTDFTPRERRLNALRSALTGAR